MIRVPQQCKMLIIEKLCEWGEGMWDLSVPSAQVSYKPKK